MPMIHPAVPQLLKLQFRARLRRVLHQAAAPRRWVFTILGILFAGVWLSQAIAGILFREPAQPETFRDCLYICLAIYSLWHVFRVACFRPEEPLEWSNCERELLSATPLRGRDLIGYRLLSVSLATATKAACVAAILLPELRLPLVGFVGLFLALLTVDLFRMVCDVFAWAVSPLVYRVFRATVFLLAVVGGISVTSVVMGIPSQIVPPADGDAAAAWFGPVLAAVREVQQTPIGQAVQVPLHPFVAAITSEQWTATVAGNLAMAGGLLALLGWALSRIYDWGHRCRLTRERVTYDRVAALPRATAAGHARLRLSTVWWWAGAGPFAWRQTVGALKHWGGLVVAIAVPGILACIPLTYPSDPMTAFLAVVAAVCFYSFLLLPTALRFDFRQDIDRMAILRALPIGPFPVVAGQLACPVVITCLFQIAILCIAWCVRPVEANLILGVLVVMVPMNVLIFALDNLLFLMYPYRPQQEGIGIFFRTTLIFTAKGMIFAVAAGLTAAWAIAAGHLAARLRMHATFTIDAPFLIFAGNALLLAGLAAATLGLLVGVYRRFDVGQDVPG